MGASKRVDRNSSGRNDQLKLAVICKLDKIEFYLVVDEIDWHIADCLTNRTRFPPLNHHAVSFISCRMVRHPVLVPRRPALRSPI